MALTFGFYDSLNHDRLYNAQQMSAIFDGIINDGVFASVGSHFSVVPGTGMHVLVKSGRAWFNSTWTLNDSDIDLTIDAADSLLGRIDTVVLEVNSEQATRANSIKVVKGTAASTPAKPTLTNTTTVHQHPLAHITVAKNTTAITASMIEIVVGKTDCPFVTAILQTTDITNLFEKWENDFQTWFSTVRSTLDGDVALNLQNQIDANWRKTLRETTPPKIGLASTATPADMFDVLADVGNLHVWRKTVTTTEEVPAVPAGYTLGAVETLTDFMYSWDTTTSIPKVNAYYTNSIAVSADGAITTDFESLSTERLVTPDRTDDTYEAIKSIRNLRGNFVKFVRYYDLQNTFNSAYLNKVYYISNAAEAVYVEIDDTHISLNISGVQTVTGYPYTPAIPASTSVTYPVSTNRNAYQEGSDAKPAGYVLGDVVSGYLISSSNNVEFYLSDTVSVSDAGVVSVTGTNIVLLYNYQLDYVSQIKGKFITPRTSGAAISGVYFIPSDAAFSNKQENGATGLYCDKMQPVTGYPAIGGNIVDYVEKRTEVTESRIILKETTGADSTYTVTFETADSITFDSSGNPSLVNPQDLVLYFTIQGNYTITSTGGDYKGKYIKHKSDDKTKVTSFFPGDGNIGYVAEDAVTTVEQTSGTYKLTATITSGAYLISSTPVVHGDTMEYLGCLGDKARVQVLSYVGTGTQGASNPCSITADFPMKMVVYAFAENLTNSAPKYIYQILDWVSTSYSSKQGLGSDSNGTLMGKKSADSKTLSWYIDTSYTDQAWVQLNESGKKYTFLAIG